MTSNALSRYIIHPAVYPASAEKNLLLDFFSDTDIGTFVDVGGNHPNSAVSRIFWQTPWEGFVVEPLPEHADAFRKAGIDIEECALTSPEKASTGELTFTVAGRQSTLDVNQIMDQRVVDCTIRVAVKTLRNLIEKRGWPHIHFLSIDTEGTEVDVLRGIDFNKITCDLILIEDWGRDFSIHQFLKSKSYKRIRRTGFNSWYIPDSVSWLISLYGYLQLFRKFILSMPFRKLRKWRHEQREQRKTMTQK